MEKTGDKFDIRSRYEIYSDLKEKTLIFKSHFIHQT